MSYDNILVDWLNSSFDNIAVTKEWNLFISDLHDSVEHQLSENNIENFNNLLEHEKTLIIQRALQSLNGSVSYQIISEKISQTLDLQLNNEAERIIRIDLNPFHTRTEAILTAIFEGIISILGRWPNLKHKLSEMFNQKIPKHLRHHIWKAILSNANVLENYRKAMKTKSKENISKYDKEISQYCENLLNNESIFSEMKGSVGCFYGMKAVLSYFQATTLKDKKLQRNDYLLIFPIIFCVHEKLSLREPPPITIMEVLVQEYFFLRQIIADDLPFLENSEKTSKDLYRVFCQQVYRHIVRIDLGSAQALMDHIIPAQSNIVATEAKLFDQSGEIIERLIRPVLSTLFVGFLSMDTVMFVWDQFLLGFDKTNFREIFWSIITAIFVELIVKRRIINRNKSVVSVISEELMKEEGVKLRAQDFQYQINKNFYVEIMRVINSSNVFGFDPIAESKSHSAPKNLKWQHWFDSIHYTSPISPQNRLDLRVLREHEREKLLDLQKQLESEKVERLKWESNHDVETKLYTTNYNMMVQKVKKEKEVIISELDYMREKNENDSNLIKELKEEVERLQSHTLTSGKRVPLDPRVTPISQGSTNRVTPIEPYQKELNDFAKEYFSEFSNSLQRLLHGEGKERFDLNDRTIEFMKSFEVDKQKAELKLFGRTLDSDELRTLDNTNDGYYSQKIYQEIAKMHDTGITGDVAGNSTI